MTTARAALLIPILSLFLASTACVQTGASGADLEYESGNYESAAEQYRDFIRVNEKSTGLPEAYIGLAWSEYKLGHFFEAQEAVEILRSRFPQDRLYPAASYISALCDFEQRNYVEAIETLDEILLYYPESSSAPDARFLLGRSHAQLLRYEPAAENFRIYAERYVRTPYLAAALIGRAEALVKLGRLEEAIEVYEEYILRFPEHADRGEIVLALARLQRTFGNLKRAEELLLELRVDHPEWEEPKVVLGELAGLYEGNQQFEKAAEIHDDLFRITPDEEPEEKSKHGFWLADYYAVRGDTERAREYYSRLADDFRNQPSHPLALRWMMRYELDRKRYEIAVRHATVFLERYYTHAFAEEIQEDLIALLMRADRSEDARNYLADLVQRRFTSAPPSDFFRLAGLDIDIGNYEGAVKAAAEGIARARRLEEKSQILSGLNYLMIASKLLDRTGDAVKSFWEIQEIEPNYLTADETLYWKGVEEKFFRDAKVPPEFASKETYRSDWHWAVYFDGIDPVHADSATILLVSTVSRLLTTSIVQDDAFRRVEEKNVKLRNELISRDAFDALPIQWFPLRSTVGADWIVHGRVTLDPIREDKPITLHIRMLRIDYEGVFPFEYWYHFAPRDVNTAGPDLVRDLVEKLKLYRPER